MVSTVADKPREAEAAEAAEAVETLGTHSTVRRVPVLDWSPASGFHMAAQFFTQAAYIMELAQSTGEKISPEEALEASAVQLSCQLELNPECMTRVKAAMREGLCALDSQ